MNAPYVTITVDLGKDEPISGVAFDTAAGTAGVEWPAGIDILVSSDGKVYHHAGELVALDRKLNGPWPKGYAIRRLATHELRTRGRYVQFLVIAHGPFTFCDEVEVFRGPRLATGSDHRPAGHRRQAVRPGTEAGDWPSAAAMRPMSRRWKRPSELSVCRLTPNRGSWVGSAKSTSGFNGPHPSPGRFRYGLILPLGRDHEQLFALQAELWKAMGCPALSAWVPSTWERVPLFGPPPSPGGRDRGSRHAWRVSGRRRQPGQQRSRALACRTEDGGPGSRIVRSPEVGSAPRGPMDRHLVGRTGCRGTSRTHLRLRPLPRPRYRPA